MEWGCGGMGVGVLGGVQQAKDSNESTGTSEGWDRKLTEQRYARVCRSRWLRRTGPMTER